MITHIQKSEIKLSAIVPITNVDKNFDSLNSLIMSVNTAAIELILVHDITNENTSLILKKTVDNFNFGHIAFMEGKYGSPGYARNEGLKIAKGDWVVFWDCDDRPFISNIFTAITTAAHDTDIIVGECVVKDRIKQKTKVLKASFESVCMNPGLWRMAFRREVVQRLEFKEFKMGEDQLFLRSTKFTEKNVSYQPSIFYEYRTGHSSQLTRKKDGIDDLNLVIKSIYKSLQGVNSNKTLFFGTFLIVRQSLTVFKRGNMRLKIKALMMILHLLLGKNFKLTFFSIKIIFLIAYNSQSNKLV
jgi:glycosyltransferase involved in cell wall biosynthesis